MTKRQDMPEENHPDESEETSMSTPSINELASEVERWFKGRHLGDRVYGVPRVGKTRYIKHIIGMNLDDGQEKSKSAPGTALLKLGPLAHPKGFDTLEV